MAVTHFDMSKQSNIQIIKNPFPGEILVLSPNIIQISRALIVQAPQIYRYTNYDTFEYEKKELG